MALLVDEADAPDAVEEPDEPEPPVELPELPVVADPDPVVDAPLSNEMVGELPVAAAPPLVALRNSELMQPCWHLA